MPNDECLRIFEEGLAIKVREQLRILDEEINALKRRQAAKGLLLSGSTIREVARFCKEILESRVEYIFENLSTLPFKYSTDLNSKISEVSLKYFPVDLGELKTRMQAIIDFVCQDSNHAARVKNRIFPELVDSNQTAVNHFINNLDRFIISLSTKNNIQADTLKEWAGGEHVTHATLAIIFTDIVGSTSLGLQLGDEGMAEVYQKHFAQCRQLLDKHKGYKIKTIGDSLMGVFKSVGEALDFAIELQDEPGNDLLKIRAGIHIGQIKVENNNDVSGTSAVNFTSRIVKAIGGPEIWLSDRAKQDIDSLGANRHSHLKWEPCEGISVRDFPGKTLWRFVDVEKNLTQASPEVLPTPSQVSGKCQPQSMEGKEPWTEKDDIRNPRWWQSSDLKHKLVAEGYKNFRWSNEDGIEERKDKGYEVIYDENAERRVRYRIKNKKGQILIGKREI